MSSTGKEEKAESKQVAAPAHLLPKDPTACWLFRVFRGVGGELDPALITGEYKIAMDGMTKLIGAAEANAFSATDRFLTQQPNLYIKLTMISAAICNFPSLEQFFQSQCDPKRWEDAVTAWKGEQYAFLLGQPFGRSLHVNKDAKADAKLPQPHFRGPKHFATSISQLGTLPRKRHRSELAPEELPAESKSKGKRGNAKRRKIDTIQKTLPSGDSRNSTLPPPSPNPTSSQTH